MFIGIAETVCPAQTNTRFIVVNNTPLFSYFVSTNGSTPVPVLSSQTGVVDFRTVVTPGDVIALSPDSSSNTQPPPPPFILAAGQEGAGCFRVTWVPLGDPTVTGYVVNYGTSSGTYDNKADAGNVDMYDVCGLSQGTWYVAVQAKNYAGQLSAYSSELTVVVTATPVFINAFSARAAGTSVELVWHISADEIVTGFSIRRAKQGDPVEIDVTGGRLLDPGLAAWTDHTVEPATAYRYSLVVVGENNTEYRSREVRVTTPAHALLLEQNVPNPFNPSTTISFLVPGTSRTTVTVYDISGAVVKTLVDAVLDPGRRTVVWDGTNASGETVGSGTYFYRLVTNKKSVTRKMLLLK
jgi:hypothetical protein